MIGITGATGTVGRPLLDELADRGIRPRALVRHGKAADAVSALADPMFADFETPESLRQALRGVQTLFLLTPLHPRQGSVQCGIIEAAEAAGVSAVVKLSALGIGRANSSIHREHEVAEKALARSGMSYAVLRPNAFMQNSSQWLPMIARRGEIMMPVGDARVSWIDARDIASVAAQFLAGGEFRDEVHDLTGPRALPYEELAATLSEAAGYPIRFRDVSPQEAQRAMLAAGAPEWAVRARLELYRTYRLGHAEKVTSAVAELTGRLPRTFAAYAAELEPRLAELAGRG